VSKQSNVYDLTEGAAGRYGLHRLVLWQKLIDDLLSRRLPANLSEKIDAKVSPQTLGDWLVGLRDAVDRDFDPQPLARFLRRIIVQEVNFKRSIVSIVQEIEGATSCQMISGQRLKRATKGKIAEAITAIYDMAEQERSKPPNIKEIVKPVQNALRTLGYEASGRQIQGIAEEPKFRNRRRKPGPTIRSER
jgi:hypothetical protein